MSDQHRDTWSFGRYVLQASPRALIRDGITLAVPDAPLVVLEALLRKPGQVVSHEELAGGGPSSANAALRSAVRQLRQVLRDPVDYPIFIEGVRGSGYRFVAPVTSGLPAEVRKAEDPGDPPAALIRWTSDDDAAIAFSITWLAIAVPGALLFLDSWYLLVAAIPPVLRLATRMAAARRLCGSVDRTDVARALDWADTNTALPVRPAGWRAVVQRARRGALAVSAGSYFFFKIGGLVGAWQLASFSLAPFLAGAGAWLALLAVDAVASPRPAFAHLRATAGRRWRAWIRKTVGAPADPDPYLAAATDDVERLLAQRSAP